MLEEDQQKQQQRRETAWFIGLWVVVGLAIVIISVVLFVLLENSH